MRSAKSIGKVIRATFIESLEDRRLLAAALALSASNRLLAFDTDTPGVIDSVVPVTGLQTGETLLAIDFRPATGGLYGLGSSDRLYQINRRNGVATAVGANFAVSLSGTSFDLDFNPTVDRIRVVSNADQNLRLNPFTGGVVDSDAVTVGVQIDTPLTYASGDPSDGADPVVIAAAYNNNRNGASQTTLFGLDSASNSLVTIGGPNGTPSPNGGQLTTIGALGVDIGRRCGLDIRTTADGTTNTAFAALQVVGTDGPQLYSIDLTTGTATSVGAIGANTAVTDIALLPTAQPVAVVALTTKNEVMSFFSDDPNNILRRQKIRGLATGEDIIGIDYRPANGQLFAVSSLNKLYTLNPKNGRLAQVGVDLAVTLGGDRNSTGFDFNPTVDRIRVTNSTDQNLRLNPDTGAVVDADAVTAGLQTDGVLAYAGGDANDGADPNVTASGYTNNTAGATTTTLFDIDTGTDALVTQNPPNNGTLNTVGALGINAVSRTGFDITTIDGNNLAFAALQPASKPTAGLYSINLTTGAATRIGAIGGNRLVAGLAVVPQS